MDFLLSIGLSLETNHGDSFTSIAILLLGLVYLFIQHNFNGRRKLLQKNWFPFAVPKAHPEKD